MTLCRRSSGLIAAVILAACRDPAGPAERITTLPRPLTAAEQRVINGSNQFAFTLLREVNRLWADSNVFISPLSASMVLGMTLNGARGETFETMRSVLGFSDLPLDEIDESYRSLIDLLRTLDRHVDFRIANSIWYRQDFPFDQPFFDLAGRYFGAEVSGREFGDPGTISAINDWVDRSTNGKIPTIIDDIPPEMVMYLINAIYFKGTWLYTFDRARTRDDEFVLSGGSRASVKMMQLEEDLPYFEDETVQAVDLPYGGGAYSMSVLLPKEGQDIDAILADLDVQQWAQVNARFAERRVGLELPKFRLEWEDTLNAPLKTLGMGVAFTGGAADFSGMSASHGRELFISIVKQKTFVDVSEEGTEAAAATAVGIGVTSAPEVISVRVNRPFLFVIRERLSGTILFLGKIVEPPAG